jgi:hypothetical protein
MTNYYRLEIVDTSVNFKEGDLRVWVSYGRKSDSRRFIEYYQVDTPESAMQVIKDITQQHLSIDDIIDNAFGLEEYYIEYGTRRWYEWADEAHGADIMEMLEKDETN